MDGSRPDSGTLDIAWRDDLTGAWNRRYLRRLLSEEWAGLTAAKGPVTLLVLDLDGFKPVNDIYGHAAGDKVLRWATEELRHHFRDGDRLIRYGGDEFVVALTDVGAEEARTLAERARFGFTSAQVDDAATGQTVEVPISFSIGVASFPEDGTRGEDVLAVADRRLYEEKRERRKASEPALAGSRVRLVVAAVAAIAAVALATAVAVRRAERPPAPPPAALSAGSDSAAGSPGSAGSDTPREIVVRDDAELDALRAEVERLRRELAEESAGGDRTQYELKIRELESRVAEADREAAAGASASPASDVEGLSGMRVGERRTREDLAAGAAGDTPPPPPARSATPPGERVGEAPAVVAAETVVLPRLIRAPRVDYPPLARRHRRTAVVEIELTVNAEGRVTAAELVSPPAGLGFDEAAREAGRSARFAPGTRGGVPVEMKTRLSVRFEL